MSYINEKQIIKVMSCIVKLKPLINIFNLCVFLYNVGFRKCDLKIAVRPEMTLGGYRDVEVQELTN